MATTADIKRGVTIEFNGKLYQIVYFQHVKPGKGGAFVRTKLKSLENGRVIDNTFNAGVKINLVRIERRPYQFLYSDDLGFHFMHNETYEQISLNADLIENADLMKEGQMVEMVFHAENEAVLTCDLLPTVEMVVTYTEPGIKGDTATNTLKQATIETGATIMVPLFINIGDKIKIDTATRDYMERVK
ncbi:MAG TPA: elongation factor P [Bacteroidales bacterium]|nr:elongation factor P [Bacteroidales bacterium]HOE05335.1 elongation factor P [Bacteroidales bacterium]